MSHQRIYILKCLGVLFLGLTTSCAHDPLAARCEKTNWYTRAYDQAILGQPLRDQGELLRACENRGNSKRYFSDSERGTADGKAKYCAAESVLYRASKGQVIDLSFCAAELKDSLQQAQIDGLKLFCTPQTALDLGSLGGKYEGQCPKAAEKTFIPNYRKGRKQFLKQSIAKNEEYLGTLTEEIKLLELERKTLARSRPDADLTNRLERMKIQQSQLRTQIKADQKELSKR